MGVSVVVWVALFDGVIVDDIVGVPVGVRESEIVLLLVDDSERDLVALLLGLLDGVSQSSNKK